MIAFIAPWYNYFPVLPMSLMAQRIPSWKLYLIHDGPLNDKSCEMIYWKDDIRITMEVPATKVIEEGSRWGHHLREKALQNVNGCDWVVHTNADNYYVPGFCNIMLESSKDADIVYCDMLHDYLSWSSFKTEMKPTYIDCGAVMVRSDWAKEEGWKSRKFGADWIFISNILASHPESRTVHVPLPLFIHN